MNEEMQARFDAIMKKAKRKAVPEQRRRSLEFTIRELRLELDESTRKAQELLDAGELPFPQDAEEYHAHLDGLIQRLEFERDRIDSQVPSSSSGSLAAVSQDASVVDNLGSDSTTKALSEKLYFTTEEVSQYTGIPRSSIYKMTHYREIPFSKPKGKLVFNRREIDRWMEKHGRKPLG